MTIQLKPDVLKFIDDQLRDGRYDSAEEVVEAGLASLEQKARQGDFAPDELDELLAQGEADIQRGDTYDGPAVFREIEELSAARRRAVSK